MARIKVDLSVISTANEKMVFDCLDSILDNSLSSEYELRIIVTCNNPASGLPSILERDYPMVDIIENEATRGFAANHNVVVRNSEADYVFVINDDTIIIGDAVQKMIRFMEMPENQSVGMLCPRLLNADRTVQFCTFSYPSVLRSFVAASGLRGLIPFKEWGFKLAALLKWDQGKSRFWNHDETREVQAFMGAFMLVRNQAAAEVGVMHEASLFGGEEIEWHYRIRKAGWKIVFYPEAEIIHLHRMTTATDSRFWIETLKGTSTFFRRHRPKPAFFSFVLLTLGSQMIKWIYALIFLHKEKRDFHKSEMRAVLNSWR